jgi:hypothetical protein
MFRQMFDEKPVLKKTFLVIHHYHNKNKRCESEIQTERPFVIMIGLVDAGLSARVQRAANATHPTCTFHPATDIADG